MGPRLKALREAAGMSVADVARAIGKSESVVRRYEGAAGGIVLPSDVLAAYLQAVGAPGPAVLELLGCAPEALAERVGLVEGGA